MPADPAHPPSFDPLPLEPAVAAHPLVTATRRLAEALLVPQAAQVDATEVPASHVRAVAEAGLLGRTAPVEHGGGGASTRVGLAVTELLAGACGNTWFVVTQHGSPMRAALATSNPQVRDELLPGLVRGRLLGGVAFSHLRRPGPPPVIAVPDGDGWRVTGTVAWFTSWGLADVFLLGAVTPDDEVVFGLVDAVEQPGLTTTGPMALAAMAGTRTTGLRLDGLRLAGARVTSVAPMAQWRAADRVRVAHNCPASLGLLRSVLVRLHELGTRRREQRAVDLAVDLGHEGAAVRAAGYEIIERGAVDPAVLAGTVDDQVRLRAHAAELAVRASAALVAAGGGASMALSNPAQRWAREALFHLIQAQTGPIRSAQLDRFASGGRA